MIGLGRLQAALEAARTELLRTLLPEGYWEGHLSSSALSTATAMTALALAARAQDDPLVVGGLKWLVQHQNADGGWGDTPESPSNLATTLLAQSALTIAASLPETQRELAAPAMRRAEAYLCSLGAATPAERVSAIRAAYGADRTFAVPILLNCALAGLVPWDHVPPLPFELSVLPRSVYGALRLHVVSYALPALIAVGLAIHRRSQRANPLVRAARTMAAPAALRKLVELQPPSGGFLEATPLTAFVAMSLISAQERAGAVVESCLSFLRASVRPDGSWPIDSNLSVWLTTAALNALRACGGLNPDQAATIRRWIAARQYSTAHPYTGARPGGWSWTHLPGGVPDADDTAGAILALAGTPEGEGVAAGIRWLLGLQNADGGWPTFCRGWGRLPFDRSCADITAHALRALAASSAESPDQPDVRRAVQRGLAYLQNQQRPDGSWLPLWFGNQWAVDQRNSVIGTARVLRALARCDPQGPPVQAALDFLTGAQNADGGWGGEAGVTSTVEETAAAVSALSDWPQVAGDALERGLAYLVSRVEDGSWTRPSPIGLYFARLWYAEELYPVIWTLEALGRAHRVLTGSTLTAASPVGAQLAT